VAKIREFKATDLDRCVGLFVRVFSQPPWEDLWPSAERALAYLSDIVGTPGFRGFIAYEGRKLLAMCLGHKVRWWAGDEFYLDELCVDLEVQRKGIGTKLVAHAQSALRREGVQVFVLLTERDTPAECFYARQGFASSAKVVFMYRPVDQG
jgi:aminoglycoside 6'-N-acetyltransferase I